MYANLAFGIYLAMQPGSVASSDDPQPVPIVVELQTEGEGKDAKVTVGKRIVVLAQVNEEEEEHEGSRARVSREPNRGERGPERGSRERADLRVRRGDLPERERIEADRTEGGRRRVQIQMREDRPDQRSPLGMGRMDRQLREQAERIERLEGEVRQLHDRLNEAMKRLRGLGSRDVPRIRDRQDQSVEGRSSNPEARVRALEEALAKMKERAGGAENDRTRSVREAIEARADAERRSAEAARRDQERKATAQMLEQIRAKREQAKKQNEQQREAVARQMRQAMERLEQDFKQSDAQMEKAIGELEKKLASWREGGEGKERDR